MTTYDKTKSKKDKSRSKLLKLKSNSESDGEGSEHELSYYSNDRIKLMKEVLKIIKAKKIKSMAPKCTKHLDISEINSMLLEELLGISNKRLKCILNGESLDEESSSTESEEEKQPVDVISLDDITDSDDDNIQLNISQKEKDYLESELPNKEKNKKHKVKLEKDKSIKSEGADKSKNSHKPDDDADDKIMSALELVELQARARAIRSQLALEVEKKKKGRVQIESGVVKEESDSDAVIVESPKNDEIVISSSESESGSSNVKNKRKSSDHFRKERSHRGKKVKAQEKQACDVKNREIPRKKKVSTVRDVTTGSVDNANTENTADANNVSVEKINENKDDCSNGAGSIKIVDPQKDVIMEALSVIDAARNSEIQGNDKSDSENEGIVINLDECEIDGIENN